jgi:hypothetical protein
MKKNNRTEQNVVSDSMFTLIRTTRKVITGLYEIKRLLLTTTHFQIMAYLSPCLLNKAAGSQADVNSVLNSSVILLMGCCRR